jgi:O-antigen ligase
VQSADFFWGETAVTLPLAAFSLLILLRLTAETAHLAAMVGLCWFVYLFLVNHPGWQRAWLWRVLAAVLLVQGAVAVGQFLLQRELGLTWLGEPTLDLLVEGTSVAQRDGQNWLRAYGLNSHPNQLGLLLMALCLLLWPNRHDVPGRWRWLFWLGLAAGVAGLLVSLSRSALAGLLVGGLVYALHRRPGLSLPRREFAVPLALLGAGVLLFALAYGDVMAGRFLALDSPLESRSLWERQRDLGVAWQMVGERPFLGTGLGQYLPTAAAINPEAALVHNVPLLIGAELGLVGLALWLLFWLGPLWRYGRSAKHVGATAVWLALILIALLHPEPTLTLPKGAVLWGLAAAQWPSPCHQRSQNAVTLSPHQPGSQT